MRSWTSGRGWHWVRDAVRTQLWPLPAAGVTFAVAVGVWLPQLDAEIDDNLPGAITDYLFGGGASAARAVLEAIAGSLITVTSLTFSLTVVTLQLASSQFSPRLLRTFSSDRFVQATLALFLGTFSYALTVLRTIRTAADDRVLFVPQMAVTLAFVLAIASVMALVLFLAHLVREIRVETMLANVHHDATETLRKVLPAHPHAGTSIDVLSQPGPDAVPLSAATSGFLVRVDEHGILIAAEEARAVVMIDREPGSSIVAGTPIGLAWPLRGHSLDADGLTRLQDRAGRALRTGNERTAAQDPGFGLRQLTDVATKALSPGINDPTTAIHALADRLKTTGLEQLRDFFDRRDLGLILIGMPGFDRQLARYPQLYSRIGFAHQYKPLDVDDLPLVLTNHWHQLGLPLDPDDAHDFETVSAVVRITGGNFRLIERLMTQVARVMEINQLDALDPDVVHAARQMLVVGTN